MSKIFITGASLRAYKDHLGVWYADYICHKCGAEIAGRHSERSEQEAKEFAETAFDKQQRRYCYRCGYKLTTNGDIPEDRYIAAMNEQIDALEEKVKRLKAQITEMGVSHGAQ